MRNHEAIMRALRELPEVEGEDFASSWARAWEVVHPGEPAFVGNEGAAPLAVRNLVDLEERLARLELECWHAGLASAPPGRDSGRNHYMEGKMDVAERVKVTGEIVRKTQFTHLELQTWTPEALRKLHAKVANKKDPGLEFEPVSTLNAGPGKCWEDRTVHDGEEPGELGFVVRSTLGAGPGAPLKT